MSAKKVVLLRDSRSQFIRSLTLYRAPNKVIVSLASKERSLGSVLAPNEEADGMEKSRTDTRAMVF